jgi:DNA invertase Pin-like site-specific DNA recombinase
MNSYISPPASLPPGSTCWAYLRDSGGVSQGESIDRQKQEIRDYCTRHGLQLVHVYFDEARSGGSLSGREDFDEMISASARSNHPAGVLIWDFARFSRSLDDAGYYKAVLRKHGLVIHSITDAIPEGPYSRMVEMVIDIGNEEKRRQVSRDTASGLRRIIEQYGAMPGKVPTGYTKQPIDVGTRRDGSRHILNRRVLDPEKAPLVLKAFEMRAAGATYYQINKATGLFASKNGFRTFFNNTIYKGEIYYSGKLYPCEPIVTPELWEAVQRLGQLRGRGRYGPQSRHCVGSSFLLSGFLFCQECGAPLYGYYLLKDRKYYVCSRARRRHDCPARHIPASLLEAGVLARLMDDILTIENLLHLQAAMQTEWKNYQRVSDKKKTMDQKKLTIVDKQIRNITDAIREAGKTRALLDALAEAERERDRIEYDLGYVPAESATLTLPRPNLESMATRIREQLFSDDNAERKTALRLIVSRILVRRTDDEIHALIEYHLPETKISPPDGGEISNQVTGPEGIVTLLLIIPIRKYHLQPK